MTTLFCDFNEEEKKLYKWKANVKPDLKSITIGDFLTMEYKRIKIVSKKFDMLGHSQIMVVNHVKSVQTKEQVMESITYFDDDVKPEGHWYSTYRSFAIGPFDPSEYGNPVCYYTPGYQGGVITITTRFWEIDNPEVITGATSSLQSCLSLFSVPGNPYGTYFEIANDILGTSCKVLTGFVKHKELTPEHIVEFRIDEGKPIYEGLYICLPDVKDINERNEIIKDYHLEDYQLLKHIDDKVKEYDKTYFVLRISSAEREDLLDFDYMASSSELLSKLNHQPENFVPSLLDTTKKAYDMGLIEDVITAYKDKEFDMAKALYNHLTPDKQEWFNSLFPTISGDIN